ncbi:hypothetical protein [Tolypothrix sp. VBCCA 56010]|uniref:hypothetical protein n=1 Tax=Tolypothrix sp. VBCCA 56010 TaxID=3137731 RepID=UPI003D7F1539
MVYYPCPRSDPIYQTQADSTSPSVGRAQLYIGTLRFEQTTSQVRLFVQPNVTAPKRDTLSGLTRTTAAQASPCGEKIAASPDFR